MTKTLTEQWREGTLDNGFYYVKSGWSAFIEIRYLGKAFFEGNIEVLAPVPSYDEYCNLVFQTNKPKNPLSDVIMCYDTEREKKVVERLQEQKQKVIALIKDGRFVEALQLLEKEK